MATNQQTASKKIVEFKEALAAHREQVEAFSSKEQDLTGKLADLQSQVHPAQLVCADDLMR